MRWAVTSLVSLGAAVATATSLSDLALQKVLQDASPIFGDYVDSTANTARWMSRYPDNTPIVRLNLPGTHDSATWNYSQATQDALSGITDLNGEVVYPPLIYRCQDVSWIEMLNKGIRVFDLRFAFDATNTSLVFYHGSALQSETANVEDVLFGFYQWLNDHPTEAVFLSFQYEGGTAVHASNDAAVQLAMYDILTSTHARQYFVQAQNEFGTLGEARGKITLLRRFEFDNLPALYSNSIPGVHFSPADWTDNSPDIELVYNSAKNLTAYIEDFYETAGTGVGSSASENIQWKYNATTSHLLKAATQHQDSLFWTFASSEFDANVPSDYPRIMALGNGTELTPKGGVNQQLVPFLKQHNGSRFGIVMFDYFEQPNDELVAALLGL